MTTNAKRWSRGSAALLVCVLAASSCGGGEAASCGAVSPCGGDPTGSWTYTATCSKVSMDLSAAGCDGAEVSPGSLAASGTLSLNADHSYALSITQSGTLKVSVPASCLMQGIFTLTCADAAQAIQAAQGADSPLKSVTCTGTSGCSCSVAVSFTDEEAGGWFTNGTLLTFDAGPGGAVADGYCVKGRELHVTQFDQTMPLGPMGTVKISSDMVAVRQ